MAVEWKRVGGAGTKRRRAFAVAAPAAKAKEGRGARLPLEMGWAGELPNEYRGRRDAPGPLSGCSAWAGGTPQPKSSPESHLALGVLALA